MKRLLLIILLLITMLGCSNVAAMPQALANETQKIVNDTKTQSTDVYAEIQANIDMVAKLKTDIANTKETNRQKLLNDVIGELEKVTASYESLARRKTDIRQSLLSKVAAIESLQKQVQSEIARLTALHNDYMQQLSTFTDPNPDIVRTRKAALSQAIGYVDMQSQLWANFGSTEQAIKSETVNVQQKIDSFLSIIDSSAILFRQGLNLLKLQRDINDALSLFTQDMPRIEQLSRDMEQSWGHLDLLVNTLTSMTISLK